MPIKSEKNKFFSKIDEMHCVITCEKTPINKIMCNTLITQINSQDCIDFFNDPDNSKTYEINNIKQKLMDCTLVDMPNTLEHNMFVIYANKVCDSLTYNKNVINEVNENFESLLAYLQIDPRLILKVKSRDEKFYIKVLNFLNLKDMIRVFRHMAPQTKTMLVCKHAIHLDVNCVKYMDHMISDEIYDTAIAMGHTNLADISEEHYTESLCKKYIDANNLNLKYMKYNHKISNDFYMNVVKQDINNVMLITDPLCFSVELCTYIVKTNGVLIKYLPIKFQTLRVLELAMSQNSLAKYYVTYKCFSNANIDELKNLIAIAFTNIKKLAKFQHLSDFIELCANLCGNKINIESGILFEYKEKQLICRVITSENYLNHQYRLYYDNGYIPNIDVIDAKLFTITKINEKTSTQMTELSSSFYDSNNNSYVVFIEYT